MDRPVRCAISPACGVSRAGTVKAGERGRRTDRQCVEDQWHGGAACEQGFDEAAGGPLVGQARADEERVGLLDQRLDAVEAGRRQAASAGFRQGDNACLGQGQGQTGRDAGGGRDDQLAGACAQGGHRREQGGTGELATAGDDQDRAARFLVGRSVEVDQAPATQQGCIDVDRGRSGVPVHGLGAAGRSGAAVTGVPASRIGRTKFSSRITSLPCRPAAGSNSHALTPQFGTSPARSIARICASSSRSSR